MNDDNKEFKEKITTCSEYNLYFIIDECGGFIWRMNHDLSHGRIDDPSGSIQKDIQNVQVLIKLAVEETKRFGVPFKMNENGSACNEYWNWYRFWDKWKKELSDEDWNSINYMMEKDIPIDEKYLPKTKWTDVI